MTEWRQACRRPWEEAEECEQGYRARVTDKHPRAGENRNAATRLLIGMAESMERRADAVGRESPSSERPSPALEKQQVHRKEES